MDTQVSNPLLGAWHTPFGVPPFDRIRPEHFVPALDEAFKAHMAEIDAIAGQVRGSDVREHAGGLRSQRAPAHEGRWRLP